jgi:hypothetical protein
VTVAVTEQGGQSESMRDLNQSAQQERNWCTNQQDDKREQECDEDRQPYILQKVGRPGHGICA